MKKFLCSHVVIVLLFNLLAVKSGAQPVDIDYKESWGNIYSATLYFSDEEGNEDVSPETFLEKDVVCFTLKTNPRSGREFFKNNELTDPNELLGIVLTQDGATIRRSSQPQPLWEDGKITRVLYIYPKRDVVLYKPFVFRSALDTAQPIMIPDKYYLYYSKYNDIYIEASELSSRRDYVNTFKKLMPVINDAEENEEIKHYSFFPHLSETLMQTAITQHADSMVRLFNFYHTQMVENPNEKTLQKVDSACRLMENGLELFAEYLEMDYPKTGEMKQDYTEKLNALEQPLENARNLFKNNRLKFLESETYNDYKFRFFIDLIARMVIQLDTLRNLQGLDVITLDKLDKMPDKKKELKNMEWEQDFDVLMKLINDDIRQRGYVLNDSVMSNLKALNQKEPQPYEEIFKAFNALDEDLFLFSTNLKDALTKCTDPDMIENIEMWILSRNLTKEGIPEETVSDINEGILLLNSSRWEKAQQKFNIITKKANSIAPPWYYLGEAEFNSGQAYSAEMNFDIALQQYPQYIAPRISMFTMLHENADYEQLIENIEEAIRANDIWIFHYWKAKTYFFMGKFNEAVNEVKEHCLNLNPWSIDEYYLMGDAYKSLNKYGRAEEAYKKAYEVNRWDAQRSYNEKMMLLQEARQQE